MKNNTTEFFRKPDSNELAMVQINEEVRHRKDGKSYRILYTMSIIAIVAALLAFVLPTLVKIGVVRRLVLLVLGGIILIMTHKSYLISKRHLNKVKAGDFVVQDVTITDTRNVVHGMSSDQHVFFTSRDGKVYELNTNTTGDGNLVKGHHGLLVIINDEKNVLMTANYRFFRLEGISIEGSSMDS